MIDLSTHYLGLKLKNPLVPSSTPLSRNIDQALRLEDAGAAALVMHSLFEEDLLTEASMYDRFVQNSGLGHGEADGFLPEHGTFRGSLERYLGQLTQLKSRLSIPLIASLNGVTLSGWVDLGRELQTAGADALELNVYHVAADMHESAKTVEARYINILAELRSQVSIPIAMKLSPYFSSLPYLVQALESVGARGVSLFNRFVQPDIDLETLRVIEEPTLSHPDEALLRIRWISILHGRTKMSLAATGGVHGYEEVIKLLLAGADVVHVASCLLQRGPGYLTHILRDMEDWLREREYQSVSQMKGSMSQKNLPEPAAMARASYVRILDNFTPPPGVMY